MAAVAVVVLMALVPLYVEGFWLQTGLFVMAAIVGAIGLTLLVGLAGQLSLAHAFFVAVGAYGYCYLAGESASGSDAGPTGLGLTPVLAALGAVVLAGLAGALFSPIAGRVRGIYLGLASLGLVFVGQHILLNAPDVTGGFEGRDAAPFALLGFTFGNADPEGLEIFGVPFGMLERLWYLELAVVVLACWFARNLVASRPGRALAMVRDSETAASVMGIDVRRYRALAFVVSSMYAGLAGVLMALAFGRIVPESFGFLLSIDFLVMIVIGGAGSVAGAVVGALFVAALPLVLSHYSDALPLLAEPGTGGLSAAELSRLLYGAAIIAVLLFAPGGIGRLLSRSHRPHPIDSVEPPPVSHPSMPYEAKEESAA
jgi:branched-chain amino acid transport system permease protein